MSRCKCPSCNRPVVQDGYCKWHNPAKQRAYRKNRPQQHKKYTLMRDYGISLEAYQKLLVEQLGLCAICKVPSGSERSNNNGYKSLSVDHDHKTGAIRGLLCSRCNKALGDFMDNPQLLRIAADYLEKHQLSPRQATSDVDSLLEQLISS